MTTSTTTNKFRYQGNGVTTVFAYPARLFNQGDLIVEIINRANDALLDTLELTTDYTVTILGPENATVTVLVAPTNTQDIQIRRSIIQSQTLDLPTGTVFPAVTVENALDRTVTMVQDLQEQIDRKVGIPVTDSGTPPDVIQLLEDATELAQSAAGIAIDAQIASQNAQLIAQDASAVAVAAAASVSLPILGAANTVLQANSAGNALEYGLVGVENLGGTITVAGKALLDDANSAAQRTTLGLGSSATTNTTDYATSAQGSKADTAIQPGQAFSAPYLHLVDEKAAGLSGGTGVAGNNIRTLNTVKTNTITGASLAANVITLPIGTYDIEASAPSAFCQNHALCLVNNATSAIIETGTSEYTTNASTAAQTRSFLTYRLVVTGSPITLNLTHYMLSGSADGLGRAVSAGLIGKFAEIKIRKIL